MTETYHLVKQNAPGCFILNKPNRVLFSTKSRKEAETAFYNIAGSDRVFPNEFEKGIYVLVSTGHYPTHPKALYEIMSNVYPV